VQSAKELAADRLGQQATCPVSGETFTVLENTPAVKLGDQVYLFCCAGCAPRFLAEPAKYGATAAPAAAAPVVEIKTAGELAPERIGQPESCEVGGDSFTVTAETPAIAWEGKVHLFGCTGCANAFAANPANPEHPECGAHGEH
jgi:YHS domain-containing protein